MNISLWEANINVCNIEILEGPGVNGGKKCLKSYGKFALARCRSA